MVAVAERQGQWHNLLGIFEHQIVVPFVAAVGAVVVEIVELLNEAVGEVGVALEELPLALVVVSVVDTGAARVVELQVALAEPLPLIEPVDVASVSSSSRYSLPIVASVASMLKYHYMPQKMELNDITTLPTVLPFEGVCLAIPGEH